MNKLLVFLIYINIFRLSFENDYIYESIEELVPKNFLFDSLNLNPYKIFQYNPFCNKNNETSKNIYFQIHLEYIRFPYENLILYLYENFSDILQDENSKFINYNHNFSFYNNILITNLSCSKEYYLVIFISSVPYYYYIGPYALQIVILDEKINMINISPLLSDHFSFEQIEDNIKGYFYSYNETKYVLISNEYNGKIKVIENDNNIIFENLTYFSDVFEFKKHNNYTIIYEPEYYSSLISFQFYDDPKYFKHDFKKGQIILYKDNHNYFFDIDISDYKVGDNIVFFKSEGTMEAEYQFKNYFKEKNLIKINDIYNQHFLSIKKINNDSSLILHFYNIRYFCMINLVKVEEMKTDYKLIINGPKIFLLDYSLINGVNSIGIESEIPFYLYEKINNNEENSYYLNLYITKQNNLGLNHHKKAFIYFNTQKKTLFQIKRFNYPIFYIDTESRNNYQSDMEYFQLCQGKDSIKELYFYNNEKNYYLDDKYIDFFSPVFGNFNTYFINEDEIKNMSDLNFDNIEENNFYHFNENTGYLKINCTNSTAIKHSSLMTYSFYNKDIKEFKSGQRYYLSNKNIKSYNYSFNEELVNKTLKLKFSLLGFKNIENIEIIFNDGKFYYLNNTPLEIDYEYKHYSDKVFYFKYEDDIEHLFYIEVIIGFLPEDLNNYDIKDLVDCFGANLISDDKEGVIIKIPKDIKENIYDFSIIFPNLQADFILSHDEEYETQISYDILEFIVPRNKTNKLSSPIIPLFKVDPYEERSKNVENKFFYILININKESTTNKRSYIIKSPNPYNNIQLNNINILPKLSKKYYYKINIPKGNYSSLFVKRLSYQKKEMTFTIDNIQYPIITRYDDSFNIYLDFNKEKDIYLNYYENETAPIFGFINFATDWEEIYLYEIYQSNLKVKQIEGNNKIKIKFNSLSYYFYPTFRQYYIYINVFNYDSKSIEFYDVIANNKKLDDSKNEFMTIVDDDGSKKIVEYEIDINIKLKDYNYIKIIPINKENNMIIPNIIDVSGFNYKNHITETTILIIVFSILGAILIILILIIILKIYKRKRSKNQEKIEEINIPLV